MEHSRFKIAVLGIGAVGGYYGAKLAASYANTPDFSVAFIARGEHAVAIRENGLTLKTPQGVQTVRPSLISNKAEEIGAIDFLLCCVKSYDLESSLEQLRSCITEQTVILPLINGLDATERITALFPFATVLHGCVYIVSRLTAPGAITVSSETTLFHYGLKGKITEKALALESIFSGAGIPAHHSGNIEQRLWEKFLFISPFATLTSYLNMPIGEIVKNREHTALFFSLLHEAKAIADSLAIHLPEQTLEKIGERLSALPPETTSSMHTDFQKSKQTELASLTGYIVRQGRLLGVSTPLYEKMFTELSSRMTSK